MNTPKKLTPETIVGAAHDSGGIYLRDVPLRYLEDWARQRIELFDELLRALKAQAACKTWDGFVCFCPSMRDRGEAHTFRCEDAFAILKKIKEAGL